MSDIAQIGRQHFADAMAGELRHLDVTEWRYSDGQPVRIYWRPLTGLQQRKIEEAGSDVARVCTTLIQRALDADGNRIFGKVTQASLLNDYDYDVLRTIAYIISGNLGYNHLPGPAGDLDPVEAAEKE